MKEKTIIPKKNPVTAAKNRIKKVQDKLPKNWRETFFNRHPEYDNRRGYNFVNNVYYLRTTDLRVTELLEEISREYVESITKQEVA